MAFDGVLDLRALMFHRKMFEYDVLREHLITKLRERLAYLA
jgi:hypothetical protein